MHFVYLFAAEGIHVENLSLWGTSWDTLFGVVLFNFALVIAVPAWLYEKEPDVDVPTVIHGSSILSAVLYILIGILGAMPGLVAYFIVKIMSDECYISDINDYDELAPLTRLVHRSSED